MNPAAKPVNQSGTGITGFTSGWNAVSGTQTYRYQWSLSATFATNLCSATATALSISEVQICDADAGGALDAAGARPPTTTYYWRVRSGSPALGPYSTTRSLTAAAITNTITATPAPVLPSVSNATPAFSTQVSLRPVFAWTKVANAIRYELQVCTDNTFAAAGRVVIDKTGPDALGDVIAFEASANLLPVTAYFWRVRGVNDHFQGSYSPVTQFTTAAAQPSSVPAATAFAALESANSLEVVTAFDYAGSRWLSYLPGVPGDTLTTVPANSVLILTMTRDTTVVVSGVAFLARANIPTPVPVGAAVTITVQ